MRDADGALGLVDVLAARAGTAVRVDLQILRVDVKLDLVQLRQHRDRGRAGMDSAARLRFRHALHAVDAAFKLQPGIRSRALDEDARLADAAKLRFAQVRQLRLPPVCVGIHGVHPVEAVRKECGLLPADAAADFQDHIAFVVRVARQQQKTQRLLQLRPARLGRFELLLRDVVQLRIVQQRARLLQLIAAFLIRAVRLNDRLQLFLLPAEALERRRVGIIRGVGQLALNFGKT